MSNDIITVVAGFPRCGSTLMMRMLQAGGIDVFADSLVSFETPLIFGLPDDSSWLADCVGKAVKILDPHLNPPPRGYSYKFIWMDRDPVEQAKSQLKMLRLWNGMAVGGRKDIRAMASLNRGNRGAALNAIEMRGPVLRLRFDAVLKRPTLEAGRVRNFLGRDLDCLAMAQCVISRSPKCLPFMLEDIAAA